MYPRIGLPLSQLRAHFTQNYFSSLFPSASCFDCGISFCNIVYIVNWLVSVIAAYLNMILIAHNALLTTHFPAGPQFVGQLFRIRFLPL